MKPKEGQKTASRQRPVVGITMGDPAGIGPEIVVKALSRKDLYDLCRPLVIGDAGVMNKAAAISGTGIRIRSIQDPHQSNFEYGALDVVDLHNVDVEGLRTGEVSAGAGKAAFEAVRKAIELALDGQIDATVTGPIHKKALSEAGYLFSGHTEIFAHYTHVKNYAMLLVDGDFRVGHVSTHVPMREACNLVQKERIVNVIRLVHEACRRLGIDSPRIGVAGLNPHASDDGLFGFEEKEEIAPAVQETKSMGITVEGPIPPDTLFPKARGGFYDAVVAMYHDQGHIPLKLLGFTWNNAEQKFETLAGVNITLGLPIIRTSVDHGTAFEIAGKGIARPESLILAVQMATRLASSR